MRVASVATVFNEERFLLKHLQHMPDWVEEQVVLLSAKPWYGTNDEPDKSEEQAREHGATVIKYEWPNEMEQRNAGQDYLSDYDWILNLEPDEFLDDENWKRLKEFIDSTPTLNAYTCFQQQIYWGKGFAADPPEDFVPIILTRPSVRFVDKRVISSMWDRIPELILHHFAWARTDAEIWKKISHYSHAVDFDIDKWYKEVWLARRTENTHPTTPSAIPRLIKAKLPPEIEKLKLWPSA